MSMFDLSGVDDRPKSALEDIFAEEPVALDTFIKDKKFMHSEWSLSPIQYDLVQHMERVYLPSLYPLMAQEWGGYWKLTENIPMKNLISAEWGKGCVSGDTQVYSPFDGQWRRIDSLDHKEYSDWWVAGTEQAGADGDTNHAHGEAYEEGSNQMFGAVAGEPFVRGHGKMLRVTTRTGAAIDVYEGHLFASKRGVNWEAQWTAAGSLKGGHLIAVPAYLHVGTPKPLLPEDIEDCVEIMLKDGEVPEEVFSASNEQISTVLNLIGTKKVKRAVAVGMKRLYLRLGAVAAITSAGSEFRCQPIKHQEVTQDGDIYWDMVDTIEPIGDADYWDMNVPQLGTYVANGILNSNSGKDHSVRVGVLRIAYLLLCLKSPQRYFGMPEQDSIHMLNVAANAPQAHRAFFKPLTQAVKTGWFADKADPKRDTIQFEKNLEAVSGHSDAEAQEGLNIIAGVADEIDAFKTKSELIGHGNKAREASTTAESILEMIESSASTRFPANFKRVAISYPRYKGSTIQKMTEKGKRDMAEHPTDSMYYASGPFATWEVNPLRKRSDFDAKYRDNPVEAAAKYECKPFRATAPYFRNMAIFQTSVDTEEQPLTVDYALRSRTSEITGLPVESWEPVFHFKPDFKPYQGARYAIHADLAVTGDRAGVSMSHIQRWEEFTILQEDEQGNMHPETEVRPIIRNDFTIAFEADIGATPSREIQIRWVRELVFQLTHRGFSIASVTYDGYQSTDSMQILNFHGIETLRVSTDRDQSIWKTLKDVASDGRLRMPYEQLLLDELEALSEVKGKVDHPPSGSKDLADAFACSILGTLTAGGEESNDRAIVLSEDTIFDIGDFTELPLGMTGSAFDMPLGLRGYGV